MKICLPSKKVDHFIQSSRSIINIREVRDRRPDIAIDGNSRLEKAKKLGEGIVAHILGTQQKVSV